MNKLLNSIYKIIPPSILKYMASNELQYLNQEDFQKIEIEYLN